MPNHGMLAAFSWDMSVGIVTKVPYGCPANRHRASAETDVLSFLTDFKRIRGSIQLLESYFIWVNSPAREAEVSCLLQNIGTQEQPKIRYETSVVFYGYEIWSQTIKNGHRLKSV